MSIKKNSPHLPWKKNKEKENLNTKQESCNKEIEI